MTHPQILDFECREAAKHRVAKPQLPDFAPGDTLRVNVILKDGPTERTQAFEGVCIAREGKSINESFTVRKISFGEGVERKFPLLSPLIASIEVKRRGVVRRAKLYYLRDRRGRSARIVEKRATTSKYKELSASSSGEHERTADRAGNTGVTMVSILRTLQALRGTIEGEDVHAALFDAVEQLPKKMPTDVSASDAYETALSLGEHLCPYLFSTNDLIAKEARIAISRVSYLLGHSSDMTEDTAIAKMLRHLDVAVVFTMKIRKLDGGMRIRLVARDLMHAAVHKAGLHGDRPMRIKVFLEDVQEMPIETVGKAVLGPRANQKIDFDVAGDRDELSRKLVTVMADGNEIYRSTLRAEADWLFIV